MKKVLFMILIRFNSLNGTIDINVIGSKLKDDKGFNSLNGTIDIQVVIKFDNGEICFNSLNGTIDMILEYKNSGVIEVSIP